MTATGELDIASALSASAKRPASRGMTPKIRQEVIAMVAEEELAAPRYSYRFTSVRDSSGDMLDCGASTICAPGLTDVSSRLSSVATVVCTLGPAIEQRVSQLCAGRLLSLAFALDQLGNELLMYSSRWVHLQVRAAARQKGLSISEPLSPGGRGLSLDQQTVVVDLAGGDRLGVSVTDQGMLYPVKSRSMVIGLGVGLTSQPLRKRCEQCTSRATCHYRTR